MSPTDRVSWLPDWRTALSALLIVAAFPPLGWSPLIWFCLVPWLWVITSTERPRVAAVQGVWFSFLMSCLGFYWVAYVLHEFGEVPWLLSVLGLFLYSLGGQPQFLVFGLFQQWAPRPWRGMTPDEERPRGAWAWLGMAAWMSLLYAGIDWSIPKLFKDTLGHSLYLAPWLRQVADLGGAHLLTFLIFWVNYSFLTLLRIALGAGARRATGNPHEDLRLRLRLPLLAALAPALSSAVLVGLALAYGRFRDRQLQALMAAPRRSVTAGVIQANIGDFDKVAAEHGLLGAGERVITDYLELSEQSLKLKPRPDFLVWPETSYPSTFGNAVGPSDRMLEQQMRAFVEIQGIPLLFGGYDRAGGRDFNALFALSPERALPSRRDDSPFSPGLSLRLEDNLQVYRKNILLLFGEYVPFTENSQLFSHFFPQVANFGRGPGPALIDLPVAGPRPDSPAESLRIGPVICYEALFPDYVLESARLGSDLILNITNDSWFGPYGEPILHLSLSVFRSIETRLPQLRSTNTGISALILQDGTISRRTGIGAREAMNVTIPLTGHPRTLMRLWGDWFGKAAILLGAAITALVLGVAALRRGRLSAKSDPITAP